MKTRAALLIISALLFFGFSGSDSKIVGAWTYKSADVIAGKEADAKALDIDGLFKNMTFVFHSDGKYELDGSNEKDAKKVTGKYEWNADKSKIILTNDNPLRSAVAISEFDVKFITDKEIVFTKSELPAALHFVKQQ